MFQGTIVELFGYPGRLLSASKSEYSRSHPNNIVFFNGNMYDSDGTKIWYGDIDLTEDDQKIKLLCRMMKKSVYVTREQPFRWENQTNESLESHVGKPYPSVYRFDP